MQSVISQFFMSFGALSQTCFQIETLRLLCERVSQKISKNMSSDFFVDSDCTIICT